MSWEDENTKETVSQYNNILPVPKMKKVHLLVTIACGEPITAVKNIECDVDMPENIRGDFAELAGIGERTFDTAISGKAISERSAVAISKAFNIPLETLFKCSGINYSGELTGNYMLHLHRLLSSILEKAVKLQVIFYNPATV